MVEKHALIQVDPNVEFWGGSVMIVSEADAEFVTAYTRIPGKEVEHAVAILGYDQFVELSGRAKFVPPPEHASAAEDDASVFTDCAQREVEIHALQVGDRASDLYDLTPEELAGDAED